MEKLTLPEEVVLVALDDETGGGKLRLGLDWAVAGATVIELALAGRIDIDDSDRIDVLDSAPIGLAHLDTELDKIVQDGTMKVGKALRRTYRSAPNAAIAALIERGILQQETKRILGVVQIRRYPEAEATAETGLRSRLADVVLNGHQPDARTAALISILHAAKLWGKGFPDSDRRTVKTRMAEISEGQPVSPSVRKAILRTQGAIIAMTAAAASGG